MKIKRNAEISLALAKLPPRMQDYENRKKQEQKNGGAEQGRSQSVDRLFTFMPPKAKAVPDFKRLQKRFQQNLEEVKRMKNQSTTVPEPFIFHNPKSTVSMRRYLDSENQMINPTLKVRAKSSASLNRTSIGAGAGGRSRLNDTHSPVNSGERDEKEKPANTTKFSAYVHKRRKEMESKKAAEEQKF